MKHSFIVSRFFDSSTESNGGGAAILAAINDLGAEQKAQNLEIKSAFKTDLDALKQEFEDNFSQVKSENQQLTVKVDELDRKLGAIKLSPEGENLPSFEQALQKSIDENGYFQKFAKGEKGIKSAVLEVPAFSIKTVGDMSTANITGGAVWGQQYRTGIIPIATTTVQARDLLRVSNAGPGTDFYFMRENGVGEGNPAPVAEGADKPQFDFDLVEASVKFETIAGILVVTRKALNNIPGFRSWLNSRIPQRLLDIESQQIWYGSGVSPQIKGILTTGNFVAGSPAGATVLAEKILNDLAAFEDTHKRIATNIVMRPIDYWSFFKNKSTGSGEYDLPANVVAVNGQMMIGGVPVSKTTTLNANDYVIGDFVNGAELLVQEGIRIEFFEQDATNVRQNKITVRVEETIALPVYGNNYFMKGSSAAALAARGGGGGGSESEEEETPKEKAKK